MWSFQSFFFSHPSSSPALCCSSSCDWTLLGNKAPSVCINEINSHLTNCCSLWPRGDKSDGKSPPGRSGVIGVSFRGRRQRWGESAALCWLLFYSSWRLRHWFNLSHKHMRSEPLSLLLNKVTDNGTSGRTKESDLQTAIQSRVCESFMAAGEWLDLWIRKSFKEKEKVFLIISSV